jgi:hypothetical protein
VRGRNSAFAQFGDPLHLFAERAPSARAGRQAGDGLQRAEHPQQNRDVIEISHDKRGLLGCYT